VQIGGGSIFSDFVQTSFMDGPYNNILHSFISKFRFLFSKLNGGD